MAIVLSAASCGDDDDGPSRIDGPEPFSFFVSSVGSGADGGNYGGLVGADNLCQALAEEAGAGTRVWRAYLSTAAEDARDRIGLGPWYNAGGVMVAEDVEQLHANGIPYSDPPVIVDEAGEPVPLFEHDIVTGTRPDGTWYEGRTCADWTSSSVDDVAQVGHSDATSLPNVPSVWNSTHDSVSCTEQGLAERLGSGRIYCFAIR